MHRPKTTTMIASLALASMLGAGAQRGADVMPILDGRPAAQYRSDLSACLSLARHSQVGKTASAAAAGAGIGGVPGEVDDDGDALGGALVGALAGTAAGASETSDNREAIVVACLRGRGHPGVG